MSNRTIQPELDELVDDDFQRVPADPRDCETRSRPQWSPTPHDRIAAHPELLRHPIRISSDPRNLRSLCAAVRRCRPHVTVRITSDAELRDAAIGLHPDRELDDFSDAPGLLIVELGRASHDITGTDTALLETVGRRVAHRGLIWVVDDPSLPWTDRSPSYRVDTARLLADKFATNRVPEVLRPDAPPLPAWPCEDWVPSAGYLTLLAAERALQEELRSRGAPTEDDSDVWTFDDEGRPALSARRRGRTLPTMPTDAAPHEMLAGVYRATAHLLHAIGEGGLQNIDIVARMKTLSHFATIAGRSFQAQQGEYTSPHDCDSREALLWRSWLRADSRYREWKRSDDASRKATPEYRTQARAYDARADVKAKRVARSATTNAMEKLRHWIGKGNAERIKAAEIDLCRGYAEQVRARVPGASEEFVTTEAARLLDAYLSKARR